jgi:LuxR family transcriptional regulator, quorum-sensing system regulator CviR
MHNALAKTQHADYKYCHSLTIKEKEVLKWLKVGTSTWDISVLLHISERTVKFHVGNIMQKLDAGSRTHAVAIAVEKHLIDIE